jgi:predicted TIM-barrel fold metal-dependent hydrolase
VTRSGEGAPSYRYVSADDHMSSRWLPARLWQDRLPRSLRAQGPRVVETEKGSYWHWEDALHGVAADGSSNRKNQEEFFPRIDLPEGALPPSDPQIVCAHLDLAGVQAAVFYGDVRKWKVRDSALEREMYRAYNDFCVELSAHDPDRLLYLPTLPTAQPAVCISELRRLLTLGVRAVDVGVWDVGAPLRDPVWEPLWQDAEAAGVVLCSHTGGPAGSSHPPNLHGWKLADRTAAGFRAALPVAEMVFSGVFERHPALIWVFAETRIGWVPFFIERADRLVERRAGRGSPLQMLPSEYIRLNVRFTFDYDPIGAKLLAYDWAHLQEIALWGCDYPHVQGLWPDPDPVLDEQLAGVDPDLRHEIVFARCARLYGLAQSGKGRGARALSPAARPGARAR